MPRTRQIRAIDNRPLARAIGVRVRAARTRAGMSQRQVAGARYTPAYISALETGHAKPSMAALAWIADRLRVSMSSLVDLNTPLDLGQNVASIVHAEVTSSNVRVTLDDGRTITVPITWLPAMSVATLGQLQDWRIEQNGRLLRWPSFSAELSLDTILLGRQAASIA